MKQKGKPIQKQIKKNLASIYEKSEVGKSYVIYFE